MQCCKFLLTLTVTDMGTLWTHVLFNKILKKRTLCYRPLPVILNSLRVVPVDIVLDYVHGPQYVWEIYLPVLIVKWILSSFYTEIYLHNYCTWEDIRYEVKDIDDIPLLVEGKTGLNGIHLPMQLSDWLLVGVALLFIGLTTRLY